MRRILKRSKANPIVINAKKLLRAAEGQITEARAELNALMGRDPSAPLQVTRTLEAVPPSHTKTYLLALAMARNPSLRARSIQAEIADLDAEIIDVSCASDCSGAQHSTIPMGSLPGFPATEEFHNLSWPVLAGKDSATLSSSSVTI
jgi:hypothetical protein